MNHIITQMDKY